MIGATIGPWINQLEARNSTDVWMFQVKLFGVEILVKLTKYHLSGQESWLLEINPTNTSQIWSYDMMKVFDSGESKFFRIFPLIFPGEQLMWIACWHSWSSTWILFWGVVHGVWGLCCQMCVPPLIFHCLLGGWERNEEPDAQDLARSTVEHGNRKRTTCALQKDQ